MDISTPNFDAYIYSKYVLKARSMFFENVTLICHFNYVKVQRHSQHWVTTGKNAIPSRISY